MAAHIFKLYSVKCRALFDHVGDTWKSAVVRRSAWRIGASPVYYVTIVLDEDFAAAEFRGWLAENARHTDIRPMLGERKREASVYSNVLLHGDATGFAASFSPRHHIVKAFEYLRTLSG